TVSQLGFMMLAAGTGAFSAAIFHLTTHAFFKALLFLGAGSVIHAMSGEQDIRRMGGLDKYLPWTHGSFMVATFAIAGIFPLSGFFSQDAILWGAFNRSWLLWLVVAATAALTAFYMARPWQLVVPGRRRFGYRTRAPRRERRGPVPADRQQVLRRRTVRSGHPGAVRGAVPGGRLVRSLVRRRPRERGRLRHAGRLLHFGRVRHLRRGRPGQPRRLHRARRLVVVPEPADGYRAVLRHGDDPWNLHPGERLPALGPLNAGD